jgi:hypothetical protein
MLAPEVLVALGLLMVIGSLLALAIAQYIRDWFFSPDLRSQLQAVKARRPQNSSMQQMR